MAVACDLVATLGAASACEGMGVSRASYYRSLWSRVPQHTVRRPRSSPLALDAAERQAVLDVLYSPEYVDVAPATAYAMLLDAGI
jgi:putative transposase